MSESLLEYGLIFLLFALAIAVISKTIWRFFKILRDYVPFTPFLFFVGLAFSAWADHDQLGNFGKSIRAAQEVEPIIILVLLLPPLVYESASSVDPHVFQKAFVPSIWLAGPGVLMNVALIAVPFKYLTTEDWTPSIMIAAILSATDPVAVVSTIKSLGAPKKLSTLIEGESLINDGSAFVLFSIVLKFLAGESPSAADVVLEFVELVFGGIAAGVIVYLVVKYWLQLIIDAPVLEIAIILLGVFGSALLAEVCINYSSILALVTFGALMAIQGNFELSAEAREPMHAIIEEMSFWAESVLFVLAGVITYDHLNEGLSENAGHLIGYGLSLYVVMQIARLISIVVSYPLLKRTGYGINWKECAILTWGGLRGAVALALVLIIKAEPGVDPETAKLLAYFVSFSVLLTLLINAPTTTPLYKCLKIYKKNEIGSVLFWKTMNNIEQIDVSRTIDAFRSKMEISDADLLLLSKLTIDLRDLKILHGKVTISTRSALRIAVESLKAGDFSTYSAEVSKQSNDSEQRLSIKLKTFHEVRKSELQNDEKSDPETSNRAFQRALEILELHPNLASEQIIDEDLVLQGNHLLFKLIQAGYNKQVEMGALTAEAATPLFEALSLAFEILDGKKFSQEQSVTFGSLRTSLDAEFEYLSRNISLGRVRSKILYIPFAKYFIFGRMFDQLNSLIAFKTAHNEALQTLSKYCPPEVIEEIGCQSVIERCDQRIRDFKETFSRTYHVSLIIIAARILVQKKKVLVNQVSKEGFIDADEASQTISILNSRLLELQNMPRSFQLSRMVL